MAKIISVFNNKGGVGKSTICWNLAHALGKLKKHVLLIDFDPQANATSGLGREKVEGKSLYSLLLGEGTAEQLITATDIPRLDLIPAEENLAGAEIEIPRMERYLHRLRDGLRSDRARVQFSSISKFGLLELSRQRLRPALSEGNHITCPRCNGTGHIRDTESSALQILRMVQEESMKENTAAVHVQVPVEVTSFLLNEKRTEITKIELKQRVTVLLVPNKHLETPNYKLERLRHDDPRLENLQASYTMIEEPTDEVGITRRGDVEKKNKQEPVIKGILPETPAPVAVPKPGIGMSCGRPRIFFVPVQRGT